VQWDWQTRCLARSEETGTCDERCSLHALAWLPKIVWPTYAEVVFRFHEGDRPTFVGDVAVDYISARTADDAGVNPWHEVATEQDFAPWLSAEASKLGAGARIEINLQGDREHPWPRPSPKLPFGLVLVGEHMTPAVLRLPWYANADSLWTFVRLDDSDPQSSPFGALQKAAYILGEGDTTESSARETLAPIPVSPEPTHDAARLAELRSVFDRVKRKSIEFCKSREAPLTTESSWHPQWRCAWRMVETYTARHVVPKAELVAVCIAALSLAFKAYSAFEDCGGQFVLSRELAHSLGYRSASVFARHELQMLKDNAFVPCGPLRAGYRAPPGEPPHEDTLLD